MDCRAVIGPMRARDEVRPRTSPNIRLENAVRIVKERDHDRERREVALQHLIELPIPRAKPCTRPRFDGTTVIRKPAHDSQAHNMRVTQDFETRLGKLP